MVEGLRQNGGLKNGEWRLGLQHSFVTRAEYEQRGMNSGRIYDRHFLLSRRNVSDVGVSVLFMYEKGDLIRKFADLESLAFVRKNFGGGKTGTNMFSSCGVSSPV